jgi:hypothetical protein
MLNDLQTESSDVPGQNIADYVYQDPNDPTMSVVRYVPNPTATNALDALVADALGLPTLQDQFANPAGDVEVMFVVKDDGSIILGTRPEDLRRPHPTLVGEPDPGVLTGGTFTMKDGLIYEVRDDSVHFQPGQAGVESLLRAFSAMPRTVFHPEFAGFKPFGAPHIQPDFAYGPGWDQDIFNEQMALREGATNLQGELLNRLSSNEGFISNMANGGMDLPEKGFLTNLSRAKPLLENSKEQWG